jgi:hypothetical protein
MIQITPHMRLYLCIAPIDFRKGIDGLSRVCRDVLYKDPFSGSMFIFRNKRKTTLKILVYDGQGFWLYVKRLSSGRFNWWPQDEKTTSINLTPAQLHLLIWNGNLHLMDAYDPRTPLTSPPWKNITPAAQPANKNNVSC